MDQWQQLREYIEQHGFGAATPPLNDRLSAAAFRSHYYTTVELQDFCRRHGLPPSGLKGQLSDRVAAFLENGSVQAAPARRQPKGQADSAAPLTPERRIVNYKSDAATRAFLQGHVAGFKGFSAHVQKWTREQLAAGVPLTYRDLIDAYRRHLADKEGGGVRSVAHDTCQYNQFAIDYKGDPWDKPHTLVEAWTLVRHSGGEHTYVRYKDTIQRLESVLRGRSSA